MAGWSRFPCIGTVGAASAGRFVEESRLMSDPLLPIEDATGDFRVRAKTIRRWLTAGEIAGACKRPGNRGPEW